MPIPRGLNYIEAASLPETVFTVWHNVFERGGLKKGGKFLVHGGTSGIGITAIQVAKAFGATVLTTAGSDKKCEICKQLGADKAVNYKSPNFFQKLENVDVILDMIGGLYLKENINLLNPEGRLVFINTMQGNKAEVDIIKIISKRLTLTGSTLRSRSVEFKEALAKAIEKNVWPIIEDKTFKPVIFKVFKLKDVAEAHDLMESSEHIGKLILDLTEKLPEI